MRKYKCRCKCKRSSKLKLLLVLLAALLSTMFWIVCGEGSGVDDIRITINADPAVSVTQNSARITVTYIVEGTHAGNNYYGNDASAGEVGIVYSTSAEQLNINEILTRKNSAPTASFGVSSTSSVSGQRGSSERSLTGLSANTTYYYKAFIKLRNNADGLRDGYFVPPDYKQFTTIGSSTPTSEIPFFEGFEAGMSGWVLVNGSAASYWFFGTDTYYAGSRSAYITSNGASNSYNVNSSRVVHLYRDIAFPASTSDFTMTFYFKGMGETGWDFMRFSYSTTSSTPVAGSAFGGTSFGPYSGNSTWTPKTVVLPASDFSGRTMRMVFTWQNDNSRGTQPPAAIDNITITGGSSPPPPPSPPTGYYCMWATGCNAIENPNAVDPNATGGATYLENCEAYGRNGSPFTSMEACQAAWTAPQFCNWGPCVGGSGHSCDDGGCYPISNSSGCSVSTNIVSSCPADTKPPLADW